MRKLFLTLLLLMIPAAAHAVCKPEISAAEVVKNYKFSGKSLEITGCITSGQDVIISVRGPARSYRVWKKERIHGVWVNGKSYTIPLTDSFFYVGANKALDEIADAATIKALNINLEGRDFYILENYARKDMEDFYEAFEDYKVNSFNYSSAIVPVYITGGQFREQFFLPPNAPAGNYDVEVFKFKRNKLVGHETLGFKVRQDGFYTKLNEIALTSPLLYSALAVSLALMAGIIAGYLFRKKRRKRAPKSLS